MSELRLNNDKLLDSKHHLNTIKFFKHTYFTDVWSADFTFLFKGKKKIVLFIFFFACFWLIWFFLHGFFLWFCIYFCKSFLIINVGQPRNILMKRIHFSLHLLQWWILEGIVRRMEALVFDPVPVTPHPRPLTSMRLCELLSQFLVLLHFTKALLLFFPLN